MTAPWPREWPAVPRAIAAATADAIAAATAAGVDEFAAAVTVLGGLPFEQVASVHFRVVREVMETLHPDGLESDDVSQVLARSARAAVWWPSLDVGVLAEVLTGALGVGEAEDSSRNPRAIVECSVLVIADLAGAARVSAVDYLRNAVADIARGETIEMP